MDSSVCLPRSHLPSHPHSLVDSAPSKFFALLYSILLNISACWIFSSFSSFFWYVLCLALQDTSVSCSFPSLWSPMCSLAYLCLLHMDWLQPNPSPCSALTPTYLQQCSFIYSNVFIFIEFNNTQSHFLGILSPAISQTLMWALGPVGFRTKSLFSWGRQTVSKWIGTLQLQRVVSIMK